MAAAETYSYVNMILLACIAGMFTVIIGVAGWWASDISRQLKNLDKTGDDHSEGMVKFQGWADAHDRQDDQRHAETNKKLDRNHDATHELRNQLSDFALKVGIQAKRINKRDDSIGIGS